MALLPQIQHNINQLQ